MKAVSRMLLGCMITILVVACIGGAACGETLPWGVERIRTPCVWDQDEDLAVDEGANAGDGVRICVIDSGIDYDKYDSVKVYHPDLNGNVLDGRGFRHWYCSVEERLDYEDTNGHGTHVAGTISAVDNTEGVIGAAPKAKLHVAKCYHIVNGPADSAYREVVSAINWAVNQGAYIISMSLSFAMNYTELFEACYNAYYYYGVLLIASAGSEEESFVRYPAAYDSVIAVGAVFPNLTRADFSNTGPELEFVAPGFEINSTILGGEYGTLSGTSMAVPHVTAVAALIYSSKVDPDYDYDMDEEWDNFEVRDKLQELCLDLGPSGKDEEYGYGFINGWATNQRPLGDVNIDYKVNILDISIAAKAFGSYPGHPKWDRRADVNIDNEVNILDIDIISSNYGEIDP